MKAAKFASSIVIGLGMLGCAPESGQTARDVRAVGSVGVDGVTLSYVTDVRGPSCIVVGVPVLDLRTFSDGFRDQLRCAYVTTRMSESSLVGIPATDYNLSMLLSELDQVREGLGLDSVIIVGHSIHGMIAVEYARRYPDHVAAVVAIGAPPTVGPEWQQAQRSYWESHASQERREAHASNLARVSADSLRSLSPRDGFVVRYVVNGAQYWADPTFDASPLWLDAIVNVDYFNELFANIRDIDLRSDSYAIRQPVFLALGRYDYVVPPTLWEGSAHRFVRLTMEVFEKSGHSPHFEEPRQFDERLGRWLSQIKEPAG
jgi:proline iminopeptidase